MDSRRGGGRPRASAAVDTAVFVLGLAVLAVALLRWRAGGCDPALLGALALGVPLCWGLTRFPLLVTGIAAGIAVPLSPVLLPHLLTVHPDTASPGTALLAWTLSTLVAHLLDRRAWATRLFNAGSAMIAGLAATLVVSALAPADPLTPRQLLAVLAGAGAYYATDAVLSAISVAVERGRDPLGELADPGTAVGGGTFLLVAVLGYLAAAVELALPPWVAALTLVPVLAVVVAASASRSAHQRRRQQHALFQAAVQVHAAASLDELVEALELHGSALVSTGRLQVRAQPPGDGEVGCAVPGEAARWVVARRAPAPASQRVDETALESLAALAAAALVRVRLSEESERHALLDALTGLPNRRHFTAQLERSVAAGAGVAVLFVDLDGFKAVNDTLGHAAGDELLQEAARRLALAVGADGLPARLGGDEFAVLLPDQLPGLVEDVGEAVVACLREPFLLSAGPATIGASVGVTTSVRGDDADSLLSRADAAMYLAKRSGGSRSVLAGDEA